jgi:phosphoribosylaminoimidazole carboxylase PurE protein
MGTTEKVMILMGSKNDWASMKGCCETLRSFGVVYRVHVASAHRTPERVEKLIREGEANGIEVFIAAAGMAAHLAGAVAAKTTRPVIGVPMAGSALQGFDALLSTVQMPPGIPVRSMPPLPRCRFWHSTTRSCASAWHRIAWSWRVPSRNRTRNLNRRSNP